MRQEILDKLEEIKTLLADLSATLPSQTHEVVMDAIDADEIAKKAQLILDSIEIVYPPIGLQEEALKTSYDYAVRFGIEVGLIHCEVIT